MIRRVLIAIVAGLACLAAIVVGIGGLQPREHVASGAREIAASPEALAARIGDPTTYARWRKDVKIDQVRAEGGAVLWRETSHGDAIDYALTEEQPGRRWRSTILTKDLPYGGYWIIEVNPRTSGAEVRITEHGFVDNLVFRALGRFVFGFDSSLKAYLNDLDAAKAP